MRRALIRDDNLCPEVNTVTDFLVYAIRYEQSARTASHYDQRSLCRAQGQRQPVKVGTFLAKRSEMERNRNPRFVVHQTLPTGHKPASGSPVNAPAAWDACYGPGVGQPGPKVMRDAPPKVAPPKAAFGGGDAGAQVRAAHTAAVESDANSDAEAEPEEFIDDKEGPQEDEEPIAGDDAESVQIDGDEYVAVDVYDNDYYACDDEEEHMFALTEHQGDGRICMRHVTLQKAADKLQ
ncbi:hypothetical protein C0992_008760 [Termitomyces sp. T32_za158]|nr:hypothetical protein C0992_008760 [Termitomyces sp. T32_za158]